MSRRCICSRLFEALKNDPRLRTLPLAARGLWAILAEAMAGPGFEGVLPFANPRRVALLVSAEETEVETQMETLIAEGLILREGDTLVIPLLREAAARTLAARRNGAAGGRPRRGETPEQAAQRRRQGELLMPIGKPSETEPWATASAGVPPRITTTTVTESVGTAWSGLALQCISVARLNLKRPDLTPVKAWLDAGCSPEFILSTLEARAAKPSYRPESINGLRYFDRAFLSGGREAGAEAAAESGPPIVVRQEETPFQRAHQAWAESGHRGPPPRLADFQRAAA